jgi:hypothetical protein
MSLSTITSLPETPVIPGQITGQQGQPAPGASRLDPDQENMTLLNVTIGNVEKQSVTLPPRGRGAQP